MTPAITVHMPVDEYLHRLHVLAAWWCLGSSALEPQVLLRYAAARRPRFREVFQSGPHQQPVRRSRE